MDKKFEKSNDIIIAGVCGGIAEYFDKDPTLIRVIYALLTIFTAFSGIVIYVVLWVIMPNKRLY